MGDSAGAFLRKRDVILVAVVAITSYLCLSGGGLQYSLEPCWYLFDSSVDTREFKSTLPIVTDLDGDGGNEVVMITKNLQLQILSATAPNGDYSSIYTPQVLHTNRLTSSTLNVQNGQIPVALQTGYISPYSDTKERSQVIVVVREDWTVVCYDSSLRVMWEKAVAHKTHELQVLADKYHIDDVSLRILPISIKKDSFGVVLVGASMRSSDYKGEPKRHGDVRIEHGLDYKEDGNKEHADMRDQATLEHFNIYALDANNGHVIWRHDGSDAFKPEQFRSSLPQHAFKLDSRDLHAKAHHAPDVANWNIFRQSIIEELPHSWNDRADTSMRLAHFQRKHVGSDKHFSGKKMKGKRQATNGVVKGKNTGKSVPQQIFTGVEAPPLSRSATLPHDAAEHTEYPNVVVAHTQTGVEVVALKSGAPITSIALNKGRVFSDLNGDGIVDEVMVLGNKDDVSKVGTEFAHDGGALAHCSIMVLSGLPAHSQLFNGTVCIDGHRKHLNDPMHMGAGRKRGGGRKGETLQPAHVVAAPPAVLRVIDPRTYLESDTRDVAVAVNEGMLTVYSGSGHLKWQAETSPTWDESFEYARSVCFDADAVRVDEIGTHNDLQAQLLVVGEKSIALFSKDGKALASIDVPKAPVANPVLGDFDSDGVTDIILVTEDAILGYRLEVTTSTAGVLYAIVILCSMAAFAFFASIQVASSSTKSPVRLGTIRATDSEHID